MTLLGEEDAYKGADHRLVLAGDAVEQVPGEAGPTPLRLRAVEHGRDGDLRRALGVAEHKPRWLRVVIRPLRCGR